VPTLAEWDDLIARNPFAKAAANTPTAVHAALLASLPKSEDVKRIRACAVKAEDIKIIDGVAYIHTPYGFGPSKMREKFDQWIGVTYTARNWNTVLKLAELGRVAEAQRRKDQNRHVAHLRGVPEAIAQDTRRRAVAAEKLTNSGFVNSANSA
jgi:hypothetical protein